MKPPDCAAFREREHRLADGRIVRVRPIRAADEAALSEFYTQLSAHTRHLRFQQFTGALTPALMRFYTRIDYDRHMALVCEYQARIVGDARYVANAGTSSCEFGIVLADDWHHTGVAQLLMQALQDAARERGFERIEGLVLAENADMLEFVRELGFGAEPIALEPTLVRVTKRL